MGADSFLIFYGLKHPLSEEECDACESKQHPWMLRAKQYGLDHYWGNFYEDGDRYILLVGHNIGAFGGEGLAEATISAEDLAQINKEVSEKLRAAGLDQAAALHCLYEPDL
jgi:hypothetical protein